MATKPDAARGKTTRKGKIRKIVKKFLGTGRPKSRTSTMSPGAMGGRTKTKMPKLRRTLTSLSPMRKQRGKRSLADIMGKSAKSTIKGTGASGAAMAGQAMKLAKKLKPTGRLNVDDLKRVKQMIMKRRGK